MVTTRRALPQFRVPEISGFRAPKSFRIDTTLLSYIARHELYRQALHDKRTFTDKLNEWIKLKMEEEDRILQLAESDVKGIGAELLEPTVHDPLFPSTIEFPAAPVDPTPSTVMPPTSESLEGGEPEVATAAPSPPPPRKGPSIWDLEKQVKRSRASAGNL
jgi:hypothetical protein